MQAIRLTVAQDHTFVVGAGQWVVHNTCSIPRPGETQGFSDRRTGKPDKWLQGIYEYQDQSRGGKWYVGSASGSSHLQERLRQHINKGELTSYDDAVWTIIPGNREKLRIAEQTRIEQIASLEGGKGNMANSKEAWNLPAVEDFFNSGGSESTPGWPSWLTLP